MERVKTMMAIFPLGMNQRLMVSAFFAGMMTMAAPSYGPVDISNPVLTLAVFFILQAIILAILMNYENRYPYPSSWLPQLLTLGPLGILTGAALLVQSLTVGSESNEMFWVVVGAGCGLVITGVLNLREAVPLLQANALERAQERRILDQQAHEASQRALETLARLEKAQQKAQEEDALLADFGSALDDADRAGEGRTGA